MNIFSSKHDNRNYDYNSDYTENRNEYKIIVNLIPENSKIIDLGCGDGSLLSLIKNNKNCDCTGVEISQSGVEKGKEKGLNIIQGKIDEKLPFEDSQFDFSICNVTMQMVNYPEVLFNEMIRISKKQIISFPNFAFYKNRIDLLLNGRMPRTMLFEYDWFNTGHIHQFSVKDFLEFVDSYKKVRIVKMDFCPTESSFKNYFMKKFPNLFQHIPIFLLEKVN